MLLRRPKFLGLLALVLMATGLSAEAAAPAQTTLAPSNFYVPINRSELLTTNTDIAEVIVADPEVANVVTHGKRKISVLGVSIGQTSLRLMDANQKVIRSTDVYVTYDLPALRRALKEFLPTERIGVSMVNTRIALTGDVSSASAAASAVEIATEFVRGKLLAADVALRPEVTAATSPVLNLMKISAGQQVMLRIKIGEVNRSALRDLGVNLQAIGDDALGFAIATGTGTAGVLGTASAAGIAAATAQAEAAALAAGATAEAAEAAGATAGYNFSNSYKNRPLTYTKNPGSFGSFGFDRRTGNHSISSQIDALEQHGMLKILAEPSLTALSGEEAQFLAGGEFPIPVPQQLGGTAGSTAAVTVQYKPYGVALKFIPYVLSKNRIRIQVQPEVSDLSPENSINTAGFEIPSFITRRASTTVELAPGESFMIAGLLRDDMTSSISQLPGSESIPVLGALFRSTAYQRRETELVISVTPYVVDPMKDSDLKLPTDDFRPASFFESVFFGALTSSKGGKEPSLEGPAGFMTDN